MSIGISSVYQKKLQSLETPAELVRNLRRADDFIKLAVVAAFEILHSTNIEPDEDRDNFGLILGSSYGTMQTNFDVLDFVVSNQPSSPTLFSHSVFNAAAGYTAAVHNLRGCALTVTDFVFPFFRALREGCLALQSGRLSRCFVFQVETYSELLHDARKNELSSSEKWQPGVVCWLLEKTEDRKTMVGAIDHIEIVDRSYAPLDTLSFVERVFINENQQDSADPLATAQLITKAISSGNVVADSKIQVVGPWGEVRILFC